jgi:hypothetical protein
MELLPAESVPFAPTIAFSLFKYTHTHPVSRTFPLQINLKMCKMNLLSHFLNGFHF